LRSFRTNIILLGHGDIASKIALRFIVSQLPEHNYKLFLSGPSAAGENLLPEPLVGRKNSIGTMPSPKMR
jgi:hypothetical protein